MKCSLGISNSFEEIASLSHSIRFLYFFALITEEGFLISTCYSLELYIQSSKAKPKAHMGCEAGLVRRGQIQSGMCGFPQTLQRES